MLLHRVQAWDQATGEGTTTDAGRRGTTLLDNSLTLSRPLWSVLSVLLRLAAVSSVVRRWFRGHSLPRARTVPGSLRLVCGATCPRHNRLTAVASVRRSGAIGSSAYGATRVDHEFSANRRRILSYLTRFSGLRAAWHLARCSQRSYPGRLCYRYLRKSVTTRSLRPLTRRLQNGKGRHGGRSRSNRRRTAEGWWRC